MRNDKLTKNTIYSKIPQETFSVSCGFDCLCLFVLQRWLTLYDFIIGEPDYDQTYDPDVYYVTGHTPTLLIETGHCGIWQKNNHIAIDCGVAFGMPLGCLRLDDMKEYYVES